MATNFLSGRIDENFKRVDTKMVETKSRRRHHMKKSNQSVNINATLLSSGDDDITDAVLTHNYSNVVKGIDRNMLIFTKIPKTGGTTMVTVLRWLQEANELNVIRFNQELPFNDKGSKIQANESVYVYYGSTNLF